MELVKPIPCQSVEVAEKIQKIQEEMDEKIGLPKHFIGQKPQDFPTATEVALRIRQSQIEFGFVLYRLIERMGSAVKTS